MTDVELDERVTALEETSGIANGKLINYGILCKQSAFNIFNVTFILMWLLLQTFFYSLILKANI